MFVPTQYVAVFVFILLGQSGVLFVYTIIGLLKSNPMPWLLTPMLPPACDTSYSPRAPAAAIAPNGQGITSVSTSTITVTSISTMTQTTQQTSTVPTTLVSSVFSTVTQTSQANLVVPTTLLSSIISTDVLGPRDNVSTTSTTMTTGDFPVTAPSSSATTGSSGEAGVAFSVVDVTTTVPNRNAKPSVIFTTIHTTLARAP